MLHVPELVLNRSILIAGVKDVSQNNILAALESVTGERFTVEHIDIQPLKEMALKMLSEGKNREAMPGLTINSNFNEADSQANFWDKAENELLGVQAVSVQEAVRELIADK
jgi:hypothetical protein